MTMNSIFTTYGSQLRVSTFIAMLITPVCAYFSAVNGRSGLTLLFLGFMCLVILMTMKIG